VPFPCIFLDPYVQDIEPEIMKDFALMLKALPLMIIDIFFRMNPVVSDVPDTLEDER